MKNTLIWTFFFLALSANGQRFHIDLGFGYGFGLTSVYRETGNSEIDDLTETQHIALKSEKLNFNQGFTGNWKINYCLDQSLFLTLGARYQGSNRRYEPLIKDQYDLYTEEHYEVDFEQLDTQIGLGIIKEFSDRWSMYMSHGFTFFVYGRSKTRTTTVTQDGIMQATTLTKEAVGTPRFTFGAYGDVALVCKLSDHIDLFLNMTIQSKNWSLKKEKVTELTLDVTDLTIGATTSLLETVYEPSIETDSNIPSDPNTPTKLPQSWMPNSGIEGILGMRFKLGAAPNLKNTDDRNAAIYMQGAIGYGMPMSELTSNSTESTFDPVSGHTTNKVNSELYSYGKGLSGQLLIGYYLGKGISTEIGGVFNSSKNVYSIKQTIVNESYLDVEYLNRAWIIRTTYGIKLETQYPRLNAFVRTGLSLGFAEINGTTNFNITSYTPTTTTEVREAQFKYSGNVSLGGYIGIGASSRLSSSLELITEAVTYAQNWSPNKLVLEKFEIDGVDQAPAMTTYEKEIHFISELNDDDYSFDPNSPQEQSRTVEPFSSFMLTLGLRYYFGKGQ